MKTRRLVLMGFVATLAVVAAATAQAQGVRETCTTPALYPTGGDEFRCIITNGNDAAPMTLSYVAIVDATGDQFVLVDEPEPINPLNTWVRRIDWNRSLNRRKAPFICFFDVTSPEAGYARSKILLYSQFLRREVDDADGICNVKK